MVFIPITIQEEIQKCLVSTLCIEGFDTLNIKELKVIDGANHPLDKKMRKHKNFIQIKKIFIILEEARSYW